MKLKKPEIIIISLTLAFACFTGGYFTGRSDRTGVVTVMPERDSPLPALTQSHNTEEIEPTNTETIPSESAEITVSNPFFGVININTASIDELTDLPDIGKVIATRIVEYRELHDGFKSIEELTLVDGIGEKRFEALKDLITVDD